jgi:hypothetical protein
VSLIEGVSAEWNRGSGVNSSVLARAVLESLGVWAMAIAMADEFLREQKFEDFDQLIWRLFFGSRSDGPVVPLTPISVMTAVRRLEKRFSGVLSSYEFLSEIAHPNGESLMSFQGRSDVFDSAFDLSVHTRSLLGPLLKALRLDIAEDCLEGSERVVSRLVDIWRTRSGNAR